MTEATSSPPHPPEPGRIRSISDSIGRGLGEIAIFTVVGPFAVATVQVLTALVVTGAQWIAAGFPAIEQSRGGEPLWFGVVATYWAVYLFLPPPFFCAGVFYAVASRIVGSRLVVALVSGVIGFVVFWVVAGWGVPTTDGSYFSAINAMFVAAIAMAVAFCWWVVRRRPRRAAQQAV